MEQRQENILFAIDHIEDAIFYARLAGELNVADGLSDIASHLKAVEYHIDQQLYERDQRELAAMNREYERSLL